MGRVADILAHKGRDVHSIEKNAVVFEALQKMIHHNVGSLVVMDRETPIGIFTERDFLRRIALQQRNPHAVPIAEVMTGFIMCVDPERPVEECMAIMTRERIRHLPVLVDGKLAGLVSIGDLVKHQAAEREFEVHSLSAYITGKYPG